MFSVFNTEEEAARYRGAWIQIPLSPELPRVADTYYQFELIGLNVEDPDGQPMGTIEEIVEYPQHHVSGRQEPGKRIPHPCESTNHRTRGFREEVCAPHIKRMVGYSSCIVIF